MSINGKYTSKDDIEKQVTFFDCSNATTGKNEFFVQIRRMKNRNQIHIFQYDYIWCSKNLPKLCANTIQRCLAQFVVKKLWKKRNLIPSFQKRNSSLFSFKNLHKTFHLSIYIYIYIYRKNKHKDYSHRVLWRWRAVMEDDKGHKVMRTQGHKDTRSWEWTLRQKNSNGGLKWSFCGRHMR